LPPLLMNVALATPPDETISVPPLLMKVTKLEPPLSTTCEPPLTIVALRCRTRPVRRR
jgi:hypothetical protein